MKTAHKLALCLSVGMIVSGCAMPPPSGGGYSKSVQPGQTPVFYTDSDLNETNSAIIYFDTRKEGSGVFARDGKLLAVNVDGIKLKGTTSGVFVSGYQAIGIKPGQHTIEYCYVGSSTFASATECGLMIKSYTFDSGAKYFVKFKTNTTSRYTAYGNEMNLNIYTTMMKIQPEKTEAKTE